MRAKLCDMENAEIEIVEPSNDKVASVSGLILAKYFEALAAVEGFEKISERLKAVVDEKGVGNEVAIRAAIFDEEAP